MKTREEFLKFISDNLFVLHLGQANQVYDYLTPEAAGPREVSDDEIHEASGVRHGLGGDFVEGFILGAKWMRDKLAQPQSNKADE